MGYPLSFLTQELGGFFLRLATMDSIKQTIENLSIMKNNRGLSTMRGFTMTPNWIVKNKNYNKNELLVANSLKSFAMQKNICWPSIKSISSRAKLGQTTTKEAIKSLLDKGIIEKIADSKHKSNCYKLNF